MSELRRRLRKESAGNDVFLCKSATAVAKGMPALLTTPQQPLRVLLVDDDPVFRELLAFVLRADVGAEIVGQAADGAKGIELARELRPDVVVMDLRMPGTDGFAATESILRAGDETRVVVVSSSTEREDVDRALKAGAAAYVPKDRAVAELAGELDRLRTAERKSGKRSLSLFFVRRLVLG
jgi:DNA-binding NarL/FixJ family response regulator